MTEFLSTLGLAFQGLPNEFWWLVMLLANFFFITVIYRFMGRLGLYVWIPVAAMIANIQVVKTVEIFGLTATLGNIVYATSFLATDILSENYSKRQAKVGVYLGFSAIIIMTVLMNLALFFTPDASDFAHDSLATIFSIMPRIAFASLLAYLLSQLHDVWAYDLWRTKFPSSRMIWLRNNMSTVVSQAIDTLVFCFVAFWGAFPFPVFLEIVLTTYLLKWIVAALDTPFIYLARKLNTQGKVFELYEEFE